MKPPLRMNTKQARELGLIKKGQLWYNGQAYLGKSGRSYEDYLKDGGRDLSQQEAIDLRLCQANQVWYDGYAYGVDEFSKLKDVKIKGNLYLGYLTSLKSLPSGLKVGGFLNLEDCISLKSLPSGLQVGELDLSNCTSLKSLPSDLQVGGDLNLEGCTSLKSLPSGLKVGGHLNLYDCKSLESLPSGLKVGGDLNLYGCESLKSLPSDLVVGGDLWLGSDVHNTNTQISLKDLKEFMKSRRLRGKIKAHPTLLEAIKMGDASSKTIPKINKGSLRLWGFSGTLPKGLTVEKDLDLTGSTIDRLPSGIEVGGNVNLTDCKNLDTIPSMVVGKDLILRGTKIKRLSRGIKVKGKITFDRSTIDGEEFSNIIESLG